MVKNKCPATFAQQCFTNSEVIKVQVNDEKDVIKIMMYICDSKSSTIRRSRLLRFALVLFHTFTSVVICL